MSIRSRPRRPPSNASDEAVRRYVEAARRHAEPDPLFQRRLRGTVVNRAVAFQEGAIEPRVRQPSRMGTLGRACLYASFAVALSVGGAMAASQRAVPGEPLYSLKRGIEDLRLEVLPAQFRDELAADALSARIMELTVLVASGQLALAASLSDDVREGYEQLVAMSDGGAEPRGLLRACLAQLEAMLARLPEAARTAVERAMSGAPALHASRGLGRDPDLGPPGRAQGGDGGQGSSNQGGAGPAVGSGTDGPTEPDRTPKPKPTPKPEPTPGPERTPKPDPTPREVPPDRAAP